MADVGYNYSILDDFPDGKVNTTKLQDEIRKSAITTALDYIKTVGDVLTIYFKAELPSGDKTILDGDTTHPAGGLIAAHDNTPSPSDALPVKFSSPQLITPIPQNIGTRIWCYSHDFCDRTTWFSQAIRVVNEAVGTGDGETTEFPLANPYVIDVTHGKITDEHILIPTAAQGGATYAISVSVDSVGKTEQEFGHTGGDYTVDYATGRITFLVAPPNGQAITATYFYSPNAAGRSQFIIAPPSNMNYYISDVWIQCSSNVVMASTLCNGIWIPDPQNPGQLIPYPPSVTIWKRITDLLNYADNMPPVIPAFGGNPRGTANNTYMFHILYDSPIVLQGAYGMQIRSWVGDDVPMTGDFAVASYFGLSY